MIGKDRILYQVEHFVVDRKGVSTILGMAHVRYFVGTTSASRSHRQSRVLYEYANHVSHFADTWNAMAVIMASPVFLSRSKLEEHTDWACILKQGIAEDSMRNRLGVNKQRFLQFF